MTIRINLDILYKYAFFLGCYFLRNLLLLVEKKNNKLTNLIGSISLSITVNVTIIIHLNTGNCCFKISFSLQILN